MGAFLDCRHAPSCSPAKGCAAGFDRVPVSWATGLVDQRGGVWLVHQWQHPREMTTHRSEAGEPCDAPKWAK